MRVQLLHTQRQWPASWRYAETFLFFTAIIIGGRGNLLGTAIGTLVVPIGIVEASRRLPQFGYPGEFADFQWVAIGALMLVFLWLRPAGLLPERKRQFRLGVDGATPARVVPRWLPRVPQR